MFQRIDRNAFVPATGSNTVYLEVDYWNDYSFVTMFGMSLHDDNGAYLEIGQIKIAFKGQTIDEPTYGRLPAKFDHLDQGFFSLGQSVDFYKKIALLSPQLKERVLHGLCDIVHNPSLIDDIEDEKVFGTSLLRMVSLSVIKGQYANVLRGLAERTDFNFMFSRLPEETVGGIDLEFKVSALSTPSTNIHAIIGRNGVGKTTLLNSMIYAITSSDSNANFIAQDAWGVSEKIEKDYFSSLVSVSFSAFDPFDPPKEQWDPSKGTCHYYIGLKVPDDGGRHKNTKELQSDCVRYLIGCFVSTDKSQRWRRAIEKLGSDENFASMNLNRLMDDYHELRREFQYIETDDIKFRDKYLARAIAILGQMSSGHAIVLLTTTYLVHRVEEKTLVLLDEPESHLHPPLLSAFVRALSDLLHDRNGVGIVATHSPVVLQEIPKSCVWKINRSGLSMLKSRPDVETFGESLGLLTSEVFSLEVERSGFHSLLADDVAKGKSYPQILEQYGGQLGSEGRSILMALVASRDR